MDLLTLQMAENYANETAATINDANVSEDETWSSKKIDNKFGSNNIWDGVEEAGIINTSTGEDEESTNGRRMPHDKGITVVPGDTYYIKKTTTAKIRYTFYAADGTYIGNEDALGNTLVDTNVMSQKMIPPTGATQFRAFASSSLVNAGLTVPAGVGADIDEINGEISQINRDLANLMTVVSTDIGGSAVPLVGGGTSIKMDRIEIKKFGHLVNVNVLTWGCPIASPTNDVVAIRMPYRCISTRNRGMCGYNATGKVIIPCVDDSGLLFFTHKDSPSSNEVGYNGTDLPNGIWQAQVWYLTDE